MIREMYKHTGFVLLSTIFLLSILSLLVLRLSAALNLDFAILRDLVRSYNSLTELETSAAELIADIRPLPKRSSDVNLAEHCLVDAEYPVNAQYLLENGCNFSSNRFVYLFADLGEFACITVVDANGLHATHHYNLYLLDKNMSRILQIRFAVLGRLGKCQSGLFRQISLGIQSWILL